MARNPVIPTSIGQKAVADFQKTLDRILTLQSEAATRRENREYREGRDKISDDRYLDTTAYNRDKDAQMLSLSHKSIVQGYIREADTYKDPSTGQFNTKFQIDSSDAQLRTALEYAKNHNMTSEIAILEKRLSPEYQEEYSKHLNRFNSLKVKVDALSPTSPRESGEQLLNDIQYELGKGGIGQFHADRLGQMLAPRITEYGSYIFGDYSQTSTELKKALTNVGTLAGDFSTKYLWTSQTPTVKNTIRNNYHTQGGPGDPVQGKDLIVVRPNDIYRQYDSKEKLIQEGEEAGANVSIPAREYYSKLSDLTGLEQHRLWWEDNNVDLSSEAAENLQKGWLNEFLIFDEKKQGQKWIMGEVADSNMEKNLLPSLVESFQVTNPEWIDAKGNFAPELIDALVNTYHIPLKFLSGGEPGGGNGGGAGGGAFTPKAKPLTSDEHDLLRQEVDAIQEPLQAVLHNKKSFKESLPSIQQDLKDADPDMLYHNPLIHKIKFDKGGPYILAGDIQGAKIVTQGIEGIAGGEQFGIISDEFNIESALKGRGIYKQMGGLHKGYSDLEARWEKLTDDRIGKETRQNIANRLLKKKVDLFNVRGDYNEEVIKEILDKYPFLRDTDSGVSVGKRFTKEEREKYNLPASHMYRNEVLNRILKAKGKYKEYHKNKKLRVTSNFLYELGIGAPSYTMTNINRIPQ